MFWDLLKNTFSWQFMRRQYYLALLFFYFCYKIVESGWAVAWQILKGSRGENGGMLEYHTRLQKPWQLIILFNMLSMTPGSLSVDVDDEGQTIQVHLLNLDDRDDFMAVTQKIESLLKKAL